eukprot:1491476-Pleurochrysis_carterae.AAC.2
MRLAVCGPGFWLARESTAQIRLISALGIRFKAKLSSSCEATLQALDYHILLASNFFIHLKHICLKYNSRPSVMHRMAPSQLCNAKGSCPRLGVVTWLLGASDVRGYGIFQGDIFV